LKGRFSQLQEAFRDKMKDLKEMEKRISGGKKARAPPAATLEKKTEKRVKMSPIAPKEKILEEEYRCPNCDAPLSEEDLKKGGCPKCGERFSLAKVEEVVVYVCPHCGSEITEEEAKRGVCPHCGGSIRV